MTTPPLCQRLRLPDVASPMFIASGTELVVAQCKAAIVGSFPAPNARLAIALEAWIDAIEAAHGAR